MGAYVASSTRPGKWIDAYWSEKDPRKVVDVTGAGNAFLGGLAAGLSFSGGDVYEAALYATISASFVIEQKGLPHFSRKSDLDGQTDELWNGERPKDRLNRLRSIMESD